MMVEHRYKLHQLLRAHEGYRRHPYLCTAGKLTIGIGRNLDDVGIDEIEALFLLDRDLQACLLDLQRIFPGFDDLAEARKHALTDLRFNVGPGGFRTFKRMIAAVSVCEFDKAAREMLASKWADQVGKRAEFDAKLMEFGYYPERGQAWPTISR